jgi:E3 ubiquitin-protein ligase TRIP12
VVDVLATSTPVAPSPLGAAAAAAGSPSKLGSSTSARSPFKGRTSASTGLSYAGATKASQDAFKIVFYIGDEEISKDSTIFGALYRYELARREAASTLGKASKGSPNLWTNLYQIKFKKMPVDTISTVEPKKSAPGSPNKTTSDGLELKIKTPFSAQTTSSIDTANSSGKILVLLRLLHALNTRWSEVLEESQNLKSLSQQAQSIDASAAAAAAADGNQIENDFAKTYESDSNQSILALATLPPSTFVNNKLTAKLNRQLDEPLIVASNILPQWCIAVAREFSFLVPFETRRMFLQSTSFGFSRSLSRWQQQLNNSQRNSSSARSSDPATLGRIQRQKVRIARNRIVDSMIKVMDLYGSTQLLLEVEFFDEVGTGLGPTLEFYSLVCKELRRREGAALGISSGGTKETKGFTIDPSAATATSSSSLVLNLKIWRDDGKQHSDGGGDYLNPPNGLFPAPMTASMLKTDKGK